MGCEHKRIKSVNCELFCMDCGEKLPAGFFGQKRADNPPADDGKGKPTGRKRTAKKAE